MFFSLPLQRGLSVESGKSQRSEKRYQILILGLKKRKKITEPKWVLWDSKGPETKAACLGEESLEAALWAERHQGGWKMLLPGRGERGKARLSLEDRVEMSSLDASDNKKWWENLDKEKCGDLLLLCLEIRTVSQSKGEKPQPPIFLESLQNLQWSQRLDKVMQQQIWPASLG